MKKHTLLFGCAVVLSAVMVTGCSSNLKETPAASEENMGEAADTGDTNKTPDASSEVSEWVRTEGSLATGYGVIISAAKSIDAGEKDGMAEINSMFSAVTLDDKGRIADCRIDAVQTKIIFSKDGKLLSDTASAIKTKNELGGQYGMKSVSGIGKEWNEQAAGFAEYVKGKTLDEVKGIAVSPEGLAADADLYAAITVHIGDFIGVVEKAAMNAKELGAMEGDKLGYGIITSIEKSKAAGFDGDGIAQADSTYTVTTFGPDGKITSCILDASQTGVNFDTSGKITSDMKEAFQTKNELGDAYGMKKASGIGKEWNEQAASFAEYAVGKTVDEISGLAVGGAEDTSTNADLTASVTIGIGDFQDAIVKAAANAQ